MSPRDRRLAISAFNDGRVRTLVATDAAGEGLNLHQRCRWVINIELPWTPLRLEQRIGRVDRLGQARRVHALHLVHRDSYEATVVARLERRRAHVMARSNDSPAAERTTTAGVERRLRQMAGADATDRAGAVYAPRARPSGQRRVLLLFAVSFVDRIGRLLERAVVPLAVDRRRLDTDTRVLTRQSVRRLCAHPRIRLVLQQVAAERAADVSARVRRPAAQIEWRLAALAAEVGRRRAASAWQGSLFDRRAEQHAADGHLHLRSLAGHIARRRESAMATASVFPSEPRLVAAWLE